MTELSLNILIYAASFVLIWASSGLIVNSVNKLSHTLRVSSFFVSFLLLGMLTSTPEIAVGFSAVTSGREGIFVGNLLGGIVLLFLFVIPLLAVLGGGISLKKALSTRTIFISLLICFAPFLVVLDTRVTNPEGLFLIGVYIVGLYGLKLENKVKKVHLEVLTKKTYSLFDIIKIIGGTGLILVASNLIVSKTVYFSEIFNIAPFYISLLVLSIGTNLPELTLAVRSIMTNRKEVAIGDYLGSASANTLLFGIFTLLSPDSVLQVKSFFVTVVIVFIGLGIFYYFAHTKKRISQMEGVILLGLYLLFVILEIATK